jgi:hypothetical protein
VALQTYPENAHAYFNRSMAKALLYDKAGALADIERATHLFDQQKDTVHHQKSVQLRSKIETHFIDLGK